MGKPKRYITRAKARVLEQSIGFISNLTKPKDAEYICGEANLEDKEGTKLLNEICELNERRKKLLEEFLK